MKGHRTDTVELVRRSISAEITRRASAYERLLGATAASKLSDAYQSALYDLQGWLDGADVDELLTPPRLTLVEGYTADARKAARR